MRLLLTSFWTSPAQDRELLALVGKPADAIHVAYIENAYDVYNDEASLIEGREIIRDKGFDVEVVDLREWRNYPDGLRKKLESKDVFWLAGGNGFYLRWLLKATRADAILTDLVSQGKVYVGASAAAVVAGPTLRFFDELDDPNQAEEILWDGLGLTSTVVVPHIDNPDFGEGCHKAGEMLRQAGYRIQPITDAQAFLIDGDEQRVI